MQDYEKQQKALKAMKDKGKSSKDAKDKAVSRAKREGASKKKDKGGAAGAGAGHDSDADGKDEELLERPKEYHVRFTFSEPPEITGNVLSVRDMSFRYGDKYPWLFQNVSFGIDRESRVAIVGPNGVGTVVIYHCCLHARVG